MDLETRPSLMDSDSIRRTETVPKCRDLMIPKRKCILQSESKERARRSGNVAHL